MLWLVVSVCMVLKSLCKTDTTSYNIIIPMARCIQIRPMQWRQNCWPSTRNIVGPVMLRPFAWNHNNVCIVAYGLKPVKLLVSCCVRLHGPLSFIYREKVYHDILYLSLVVVTIASCLLLLLINYSWYYVWEGKKRELYRYKACL